MSKYYVVGLTWKDLGNRALSAISDPIRQKFLSSAKAVSEGKKFGASKKWAIIKFDADFVLTPQKDSDYPEYDEVLYMNEEAKNIAEKAGVNLNIIGELDELPEKELGNYISMPYWS